MKNEKLKKVLTSKIAIGVICFFIGAMTMSSDSSTKELETAKSELETLQTKLTEAEEKIEQAKPFFAMKAEEQAQLDAQVKKEQDERESQEKKDKEAKESQAKADAEAKVQAEIEAKTKTLSNGNFLSGTDFDAGTYDLIAVSGGGNVSSSNVYTGGINAIMGVANDGFYELEYKNIKLPTGTTLSIDGVTIKLVPKL